MTADAWTLREGNDVQVLKNVKADIGRNRPPDPQGVQAQLAFRLATGPARPLVRMRIVRDRTIEPPVYHFDSNARRRAAAMRSKLINALRPDDDRVARSPSPKNGVQR